jgi:hypothetical protein
MRRRIDYWFWGGWIAIACVLLSWIPAIRHRYFDPDELEHSHAAWCVSKGMLPYQDFFEHHTPWYYYVLRPFVRAFRVAVSVEGATHFLLFGRVLSAVLAGLSLVLVCRMGRLWQGRGVGLLAAVFLVTQPVFFQKAVEIRPDMLALPLFLAGACLLLQVLAAKADAAMAGARVGFLAGLFLGAAIMCTQKMLFVLPGLVAGLAIWSFLGGGAAQARAHARVTMALAFLAGVVVPPALTWAGFAAYGAGDAFITNNFLLNAKWKPAETDGARKLLVGSWPVLALGLTGAGVSVWCFIRSGWRQQSDALLLLVMIGLLAGLLVMPSPHAQYFLMPLPLICLFAARGLFFLIECVPRPVRATLWGVALISLLVLPARAARHVLDSQNDGQLARLRYVFSMTRPDDVVMDGWQGLGVFRPHAFRYFFLHPETRAMLPPREWDAYLDALERGRIRPKLVAMDPNLAALGPRFKSFVERNYWTTDGFLYFRAGPLRPPPRGRF